MGCQPWPQWTLSLWWQESAVRSEHAGALPVLTFAAAVDSSPAETPSVMPPGPLGRSERERDPDYYSPRPEPDEAPLEGLPEAAPAPQLS